MSIPSIIVGEGNWAGKSGNLLGYAVSDVKILPREFTVSRALNTATRVNASGNIEGVNANFPRIDYFGGQASLLVEPSAVNLVKYSEQFNTVTSGWSPLNLVTITGNTNATLDPAGGNTADLIVATTGSAEHKVSTSVNNLGIVASGTALTWSVFAKATSATSGFVQLVIGGFTFSPVLPFANFQLSGNGAVTTGTYSAASIQPFGNGWYRCSITATPAANSTPGVSVCPIFASGATRDAIFAGNGVDGVYLWGAQLETGSVATSYIPTTTGSVTRSAEAISITGVTGLIGQTEGTIYAEVDVRNFTSSARIIALSDGTGFNSIPLQLLVDGGLNFIRVPINALSSGQTDIIALMSTGVNKIALGYAQNNVALYLNGTSVGTDTSCIIPATNKLDLGSLNGATFFNNRIRAASIYQTRLPNTTTDGSPSLQSITTL